MKFLLVILLVILTTNSYAQLAKEDLTDESEKIYRKIDSNTAEVTTTVVTKVTLKDLYDLRINIQRNMAQIQQEIDSLQAQLEEVDKRIAELGKIGIQ